MKHCVLLNIKHSKTCGKYPLLSGNLTCSAIFSIKYYTSLQLKVSQISLTLIFQMTSWSPSPFYWATSSVKQSVHIKHIKHSKSLGNCTILWRNLTWSAIFSIKYLTSLQLKVSQMSLTLIFQVSSWSSSSLCWATSSVPGWRVLHQMIYDNGEGCINNLNDGIDNNRDDESCIGQPHLPWDTSNDLW